MRPIPPKLRKEMAEDPFYKTCVLDSHECEGRVEWHHVFIYASKQVNEKWAILPACSKHHREQVYHQKEFERIAVNRASDEELAKYPRRDWSRYR